MDNRINPVLRIRENLSPVTLRKRLERTQQMLKEKNLPALIMQRDWQNADRWLNNIYSFGMPAGGWYIVPAEGIAWATNGFRIEEGGRASGREGLALYDDTGELVNWLTDCDLLDMLGDRLNRDGMEYDHDLKSVRSGNAKLITGFGREDLREILAGQNEIGVVDPNNMRCDLYDELTASFPNIRLVDVTEDYAVLQAVKEPDEIQDFREIARQHDQILEGALAALRPEETEREVATRARYLAYHFGCAGFNWKTAAEVRLFSAPSEHDILESDLMYPGRTLKAGDRLSIRVSAMGTSGYFGMISRSFLLGKMDKAAESKWQDAVEATELCAEGLRPGNTLEAAGRETVKMLKGKGYEVPAAGFIHSLGNSPNQLPRYGHSTEKKELEAGMILAVCPPVGRKGRMPDCCGDMYLVTDHGAERMTQFSRELICR